MAAVFHISERPALLQDVVALGKANRSTLGFLPDGAFEEHAAKDQVLVAVHDERLAGYVLYRVSRERATVVHLCVDDEQRGRGVARGLIQKLFDVTAGLRGIDLRCRQDFPANAAWPKLGFYHVESRPGRSREGHLLDRWWFDHGVTDLFSLVEDGRLDVAEDQRQRVNAVVNGVGRQRPLAIQPLRDGGPDAGR